MELFTEKDCMGVSVFITDGVISDSVVEEVKGKSWLLNEMLLYLAGLPASDKIEFTSCLRLRIRVSLSCIKRLARSGN